MAEIPIPVCVKLIFKLAKEIYDRAVTVKELKKNAEILKERVEEVVEHLVYLRDVPENQISETKLPNIAALRNLHKNLEKINKLLQKLSEKLWFELMWKCNDYAGEMQAHRHRLMELEITLTHGQTLANFSSVQRLQQDRKREYESNKEDLQSFKVKVKALEGSSIRQLPSIQESPDNTEAVKSLLQGVKQAAHRWERAIEREGLPAQPDAEKRMKEAHDGEAGVVVKLLQIPGINVESLLFEGLNVIDDVNEKNALINLKMLQKEAESFGNEELLRLLRGI